jgi:hypothetical protein
MKKCVLLFVLIMFAISCENFLEEDLSPIITLENSALNTEEGLTAALAGAYKPMSHPWHSGFAHPSILYVLMGSDDLTTYMHSGRTDVNLFDQFYFVEWNPQLLYIWKGCYKAIQGCNNIIANWENATGDATVIKQIAGEAFFLRAYNYFWIVRLWGEAPLVLDSHVYTEKNLSVERSTIAKIYEQIVFDLKQAIALMGDTKPNTGRANRGTAKAILAEVYLHMAGWPLNDASYYQLAAEKAREVIDNEAVYGFSLVEDFADLWPTEEAPVVSNVEEVFTLTVWGGDWLNANTIYGLAARPIEIGGWGNYFSELTFFYEFPAGYRKDVTFYTELDDGSPWESFNSEHPHFKKFFGQNTYLNVSSIPLERMAEVYLIFAEAQVMATGNPSDPDALEAVNKIRRRAMDLPVHIPDPSVDWTSATQDQIVEEKGWEFAGEFCRWFDLVRLQKVEEVVARKHPDDLQPIGPVQYFMPIPAGETLANPNLGK